MLCFVQAWTMGTDLHLKSEATFFQMFSLLVGMIIKKQSARSYHNYMKSCSLAPDFLLENKSLPLAVC